MSGLRKKSFKLQTVAASQVPPESRCQFLILKTDTTNSLLYFTRFALSRNFQWSFSLAPIWEAIFRLLRMVFRYALLFDMLKCRHFSEWRSGEVTTSDSPVVRLRANCSHTGASKQYSLVYWTDRRCSAAGKVTAGLAESNGSPLPALWLSQRRINCQDIRISSSPAAELVSTMWVSLCFDIKTCDTISISTGYIENIIDNRPIATRQSRP